MNPPAAAARSGFTLLEVMVSATISLVVLLTLGMIVQSASQTWSATDSAVEIQSAMRGVHFQLQDGLSRVPDSPGPVFFLRGSTGDDPQRGSELLFWQAARDGELYKVAILVAWVGYEANLGGVVTRLSRTSGTDTPFPALIRVTAPVTADDLLDPENWTDNWSMADLETAGTAEVLADRVLNWRVTALRWFPEDTTTSPSVPAGLAELASDQYLDVKLDRAGIPRVLEFEFACLPRREAQRAVELAEFAGVMEHDGLFEPESISGNSGLDLFLRRSIRVMRQSLKMPVL